MQHIQRHRPWYDSAHDALSRAARSDYLHALRWFVIRDTLAHVHPPGSGNGNHGVERLVTVTARGYRLSSISP